MANKPKIRFKGFDDAWEQRKLGDVCSRVQGNDGRMELPTLTISASNGWMKQEDRFSGNIAGKEQKNYTLLHKGELSYNHGNSKLAKYGTVFSLQSYEEALVPRVYHSFKVEEGNTDFIEYYFATKLPDRELGKLISSGARMDGLLNIGYKEFMGIQLLFPKTKEQECIANYFRNLDNLITLHQRKCDQMNELKKYMLTKMFPQNGSKVPEIRFDGYTDDWEQRKLGEVAEFSKGSGYSKGDLVEYGTPIILYGRLYTNYETRISDVDTFVEAKVGSVYSKGGEVVVPASGETAEDIARAATVDKSGILLGGDLNIVMPNKDINSSFLAISISSGNPQRELAKKAQGKSVVHIHNEEIKNLVLPFPIKDEQNKIASYFCQLDNLITLHQHKCNELREIKKYMLKNMFI